MTDSALGARELRRQIRQWRRGRADARLVDVIGDVYVAVFSTLLLGSMIGSVLVNTGALAAHSCTAGPCLSARFWGPWLVVLGTATVAGTAARLFGPVFVSAATASWVLTTPVRRRAFLVGPLASVATVAAGTLGAAALAGTALAGFGLPAMAATTAGATVFGVLLIALWALLQEYAGRAALVLAWLPGVVLEAALLATWHGDLGARRVPTAAGPPAWIACCVLSVATIAALALAVRRLDTLRDRDLAAGGQLGAALSGALATLDLALLYDVVTGQRWRRRQQVRTRRGGPSGLLGLVWLDGVRLRRNPAHLLLVLAAVPVPYAAAALGAGAWTAVVAVLAGFLVALPMLLGVRVLTRTPGLARMLPFSPVHARAAALVVPGGVLLGYGLLLLAATPYPVPVALGALAAATRWVTGRPPDYGRPLVSTPAGAVPPNLYGSVLRGFDIVLLTGLPLLIPNGNGPMLSVVASLVVLAVLVSRRAGP